MTVFVGMLGFLWVLCVPATSLLVKQEHSLYGPYQEGSVHEWDLTGSAHRGGDVLRLTADQPSVQGAVWNKIPVQIQDWELHMHFRIHGQSISSGGEGLAIWYARDPFHTGPIFGSKDYFSGLAVFIDTRSEFPVPHNHVHPYISAVVNNGSFAYQHYEEGTAYQVGGCHMPVRNLEAGTKIAVSYIHSILTVYLDVHGGGEWIECFKSGGIYLPTGYFFGISANTAEYSDNHDIVSITTLDMNLPDKVFLDKSYIIPQAEYIQVPPKQEHIEEQALPVTEAPIVHEEVVEATTAAVIDEKADAKEKDVEKTPIPAVSFTRKALYIMGIAIIAFTALVMFRRYNVQRKERMQKRLY